MSWWQSVHTYGKYYVGFCLFIVFLISSCQKYSCYVLLVLHCNENIHCIAPSHHAELSLSDDTVIHTSFPEHFRDYIYYKLHLSYSTSIGETKRESQPFWWARDTDLSVLQLWWSFMTKLLHTCSCSKWHSVQNGENNIYSEWISCIIYVALCLH